jgi:D-beta-D-heptose 7-phosphate kinase/D-beta-D-heptose 1-phosphate adenosyltransferase
MITIVGDVIVDEYLYCTISGRNPETPNGRKLRVVDRRLMLGGAAAVAKLMQNHGKRPLLASVISTDPSGLWAASELANQGVGTEILWDTSRSTTTKTRILIDGVIQPDRLDTETIEDIGNNYISMISDIDIKEVLLLVDYNKGVLTDQVCQNLITRANELSIPVIVDPAYNHPWSRYCGATLIKANKLEATAELSRLTGESDTDPQHMARFLANEHRCQVIVTDGKNGMGWADFCCPTIPFNFGYIEAVKVPDVVDPTGCGDNVMAAIASKFGEPLPVICEFAAREAADCITRIGVC